MATGTHMPRLKKLSCNTLQPWLTQGLLKGLYNIVPVYSVQAVSVWQCMLSYVGLHVYPSLWSVQLYLRALFTLLQHPAIAGCRTISIAHLISMSNNCCDSYLTYINTLLLSVRRSLSLSLSDSLSACPFISIARDARAIGCVVVLRILTISEVQRSRVCQRFHISSRFTSFLKRHQRWC